jgi:hypothetical protein
VRFSRLKLMGRNAMQYRAAFDVEAADTPPKRFGRQVHAATLGGDVAIYDGERRGGAWEAFAMVNAGKEIALKREWAEAQKIAAIVQAHPIAGPLLIGEHEKELAFMTEGRACGARLDVAGVDFVTDLKTTASAEPGWFMRNGERMAYHAQLAWYMTAARMALDRPFERAYVVAVETKFPYEVTCFQLSEQALDMGARLWRSWWERLMVCEASDQWPGYAQSLVEWDVAGNSEVEFDE